VSTFHPGPWEVDGRQVRIHRGCAIAEVHGTSVVAAANRRLIAAAPEMYELLRVLNNMKIICECDAWASPCAAHELSPLLARIDGKEPPP
jgi:hypothetical protein